MVGMNLWEGEGSRIGEMGDGADDEVVPSIARGEEQGRRAGLALGSVGGAWSRRVQGAWAGDMMTQLMYTIGGLQPGN